jgi:transposase
VDLAPGIRAGEETRLDRRAKVELFEQIRREYDYGVGTIKGVARKLGIHRRMVREALGDAVPRERKINTRGKPRIEPAKAFIEAILQGDENAPRKQRHTAHRIWSRIREELPEVGVAESSIRRYVRERKIELKLIKHETFIPQSYAWGQEAQVDWYEAYADIGGEREKAYVFCMRSMASGGAFHCAFPHASQQAFLEAHERAFAYFGGVFGLCRYDNLKSAVNEDTARTPARRDDAIHRIPIALGLPVGVLHTGRRAREGHSGRRRRILSSESHGAGATGGQLGGPEPPLTRRIEAGRGAKDRRAKADGRRRDGAGARTPAGPGGGRL